MHILKTTSFLMVLWGVFFFLPRDKVYYVFSYDCGFLSVIFDKQNVSQFLFLVFCCLFCLFVHLLILRH